MEAGTIPAGAKCCHPISTQDGWNYLACGRPAKMMHERRAYCGLHDPVKKDARWEALVTKNIAEQAARDRASERAEAIRLARDEVVEAARSWARMDDIPGIDTSIALSEAVAALEAAEAAP